LRAGFAVVGLGQDRVLTAFDPATLQVVVP
jgi:hypothetical protein